MAKGKVDVTKKYKSAAGVLKAVLRLFEESPSNWTRDMQQRVRKTANGGVAFCATGGIHNFAANPSVEHKARRQLRDALGGEQVSIPQVNDNKGRKAILAGLRKALGS